MAATRIYVLAKELSVKSSAIVSKCQDEGLDVKNHMSAISAGLAATIREWFSEGDNVTTIETATKVDLKRVRVRKKPKPKKVPEAETPETETVASVAEDDVAAEVAPAAQAPTPEAIADGSDLAVQTVTAEEEKEGTPDQVVPVEAEDATSDSQPMTRKGPQIIEPPEPEPVVPAGPMLSKPEPAKLSGPQVVRVEAAESVRAPRSPAAKRFDRPVTQPPVKVPAATGEQATGGKGKQHGKGKLGANRRVESPGETLRAQQRSKLRQRDIDERRARVEAAGGEGLRGRVSRRIATRSMGIAPGVGRPEKAVVTEPITVKDLSAALAVKMGEIVGKLMGHGVMASANEVITSEVAELVALEFDTELSVESRKAHEDEIKLEFEKRERKHLKRRPVVATMLGHVDHGKTSLLDRIRSTHVAESEAGGITQHIGASQVTLSNKTVTFLDTPGHEAFTAMRARGANMTDVVVLVVAGDDGVMPQTAEAIAHGKAAGVPIIVALNKVDLPGCDFNRIYAQLAEHELTPTEWGGDTEVVKTSALTGEGIEDLLEHIDYQSELLNLQADDTLPAMGLVVEARMSPTRGAVATLLVKEGCLKIGDILLSGGAFGRVKMLRDSYGKNIKMATSSQPVEVTGLNGVPPAGDAFYCLQDINKAKNAAEQNKARMREDSLAQRSQVTLDNLFHQIEAGGVKELNLIVRADVQGSVEVLRKHLGELSTDEVKIKILHGAAGGITEGDVILADASKAIIIGFNVVADDRARKSADAKGVDIRLYNIIYRITEDLKQSMAGLLDPEEQEKSVGRATIRATFKVTGVGTIAGCMVTTGLARKNARVRLIRDNVVIRDNIALESLKHFKEDAREIKAGLECGVKLAGYDDVKVDDLIEFYEIVKIARTL